MSSSRSRARGAPSTFVPILCAALFAGPSVGSNAAAQSTAATAAVEAALDASTGGSARRDCATSQTQRELREAETFTPEDEAAFRRRLEAEGRPVPEGSSIGGRTSITDDGEVRIQLPSDIASMSAEDIVLNATHEASHADLIAEALAAGATPSEIRAGLADRQVFVLNEVNAEIEAIVAARPGIDNPNAIGSAAQNMLDRGVVTREDLRNIFNIPVDDSGKVAGVPTGQTTAQIEDALRQRLGQLVGKTLPNLREQCADGTTRSSSAPRSIRPNFLSICVAAAAIEVARCPAGTVLVGWGGLGDGLRNLCGFGDEEMFCRTPPSPSAGEAFNICIGPQQRSCPAGYVMGRPNLSFSTPRDVSGCADIATCVPSAAAPFPRRIGSPHFRVCGGPCPILPDGYPSHLDICRPATPCVTPMGEATVSTNCNAIDHIVVPSGCGLSPGVGMGVSSWVPIFFGMLPLQVGLGLLIWRRRRRAQQRATRG